MASLKLIKELSAIHPDLGRWAAELSETGHNDAEVKDRLAFIMREAESDRGEAARPNKVEQSAIDALTLTVEAMNRIIKQLNANGFKVDVQQFMRTPTEGSFENIEVTVTREHVTSIFGITLK